jgi:dihydroorotate dehydrogenase (fumarate)
MDLTTEYLGMQLRSPLVASAGPLTGDIDGLRALADAGIAAVVLPSLFEESVVADELALMHLFDNEWANPEADSWFPDLGETETVTQRHLRHVEEASAAIDVPVVASLNGVTANGWERYARQLVDAGADAIELNLYSVNADPDKSGAEVEAEQLTLVAAVRAAVNVPLAVKVGPYYSAFGHMAQQFVEAGADALVLFNRFYQPDVSPQTRSVVPALELSTPSEGRLPMRWIGLLYGRVDADLAHTTGIHSGLDAARALLAGADVAMMTSALLKHGAGHVATVERELVEWAREHGYTSVSQLRGSASHANVDDPAGFERANYIQGLTSFATQFQ